jgi:hypothetical protein
LRGGCGPLVYFIEVEKLVLGYGYACGLAEHLEELLDVGLPKFDAMGVCFLVVVDDDLA